MIIYYPLTVKGVKKETKNSVSVLFEIPENLRTVFNYKPGQFVSIRKTLGGENSTRSYSICTSPNESDFRIAIKEVKNGWFSEYANLILSEGDVLEVSKPMGNFCIETNSSSQKNYLAIAGGIGITPIFSMLKAVLFTEPKSTFTLLYGNKSLNETIFKTEIDALKHDFSTQFSVKYAFSQEKLENAHFGRINNELVSEYLSVKKIDALLLCGPNELIENCKQFAVNKGFSQSAIKTEYFVPLITKSVKMEESKFEGNSEVLVILDEEEITVNANANDTLLTSFLNKGIEAPYSCRGGVCSSCLAKVTEGKAIMERDYMLSKEEVASGFVLTCQAKPASQKLTIDFDDVY